ncbi:Oxo-4-hydroxy-4-carboxy-5-ureidoimidazoline decarboxylase [Chaetomidium leptoderma]|uniref:Oxo-4-hydroxy-4-carboxy-5-ureidoimidazoline decarboxylase n=1 Tax=Chaetomidium leptoderma TaxID=669021 RepID=A0AAN6VPK0_9PEZI|nr:Oxo-4-hydroxy-4-carboxy-5-ureidoimidazoline decarboxylase [Chaetomidium leptoderma]
MSPLNPAATPFLPAIASLPTLSDTALTSTLDLLFEPSADLHTLALPTIRTLSFASYDDLVTTLRTQLLDIASAVADDADGRKRLHAILGSHPRLGESKQNQQNQQQQQQEEEVLSGFSREEQAHLRGEGEALAGLNQEYEERFPGLRYVVWVNGRSREEVMGDMRRRIGRGDLREEEREGIRAMCDIAADRARKLLLKSSEEAAENSR